MTAAAARHWPRAALVLLATVLAHAAVVERLQRDLPGLATPAPALAPTVSARLLARAAPPAPPAAAVRQVVPKPRLPAPRAPAPASTAEAALLRSAEAQPGASADAAPGAPAAEPAAEAATGAAAEAADSVVGPLNAESAVEVTAAADAIAFEAAGPALGAALAALPATALPRSAQYRYRTSNSELQAVTGATTVDWSAADDGSYRARLSTSALGITVLELQSQGMLRTFGLAPHRYTETRARRGAVAANFDWSGGRVTFSARSHERPLRDGVQDRLSFQFQLMLLGQAQPQRFRLGAETLMHVAGRDDVKPYRFRSSGREPTGTGLGELDSVKVETIGGEADSRIEVWLAPELAWLPVRLRFTDRQGRSTESVLEQTGERP